jgi:hypothetical protein
VTFCKGDLEKMCVGSQPDYRGCMQVNARYDWQLRQTSWEELDGGIHRS